MNDYKPNFADWNLLFMIPEVCKIYCFIVRTKMSNATHFIYKVKMKVINLTQNGPGVSSTYEVVPGILLIRRRKQLEPEDI